MYAYLVGAPRMSYISVWFYTLSRGKRSLCMDFPASSMTSKQIRHVWWTSVQNFICYLLWYQPEIKCAIYDSHSVDFTFKTFRRYVWIPSLFWSNWNQYMTASIFWCYRLHISVKYHKWSNFWFVYYDNVQHIACRAATLIQEYHFILLPKTIL